MTASSDRDRAQSTSGHVERFPAVIGGQRVPTSEWIDAYDPSTGSRIGRLADGGRDDIDAAVTAARATFDDEWSSTTAVERAALLQEIARRVRGEAEDLARLESSDTGKPLRQARADVAATARYFEFYGAAIQSLHGEVIPGARDTLVYTRREPLGVTGHIVPWNYPLQITARGVAVALAAGNCCVVKPAEEAALGPLRLAELALDAGLPAGCLNVVPGRGERAGAALAAHSGIDHLSFTGSVEVGRAVAARAAGNLVPTTLELGGKSPNIVFDDADLDRAVPAIVNSILQNGGQTCSAGSRLLVHRSLHQQVVDEIAERFRATRIGPASTDPDLGPLISAEQRDRVAALLCASAGDGTVITGGGPATGGVLDHGYFFQPTLVDRVPPQSVLGQQEVFGPVLAAIPFDDTEQAVRIANGTPFGLVAAVWTRDVDRAHRMAARLRAGQVFVNTYGAGGGVELPFGGSGDSGYGREKGFEALRTYTAVKTVAVHAPGGPA